MTSGEIVLNVLFYLFAAIAIAGALAVALMRNIVRSAFALLAVLWGAAAFYAILRADFIFAIQVLVYVGGILVLIIFAVMLTHRIMDVKLSNESTHNVAAIFSMVCLLFSLVVIVVFYRWVRSDPPVEREIAVDVARKREGVPLRLWFQAAEAVYAPEAHAGLPHGSVLLDGRGYLVVQARSLPPGTGHARFWLWKGEREGELWRWDSMEKPSDAAFVQKPGGGSEARCEVHGLQRGRYRWGVSLVVDEEGAASEPVRFGAEGTGEGYDFRVEHGLAHSIGLALMSNYLLPFEVVSVLLLAALIGAAFLARKEVMR